MQITTTDAMVQIAQYRSFPHCHVIVAWPCGVLSIPADVGATTNQESIMFSNVHARSYTRSYAECLLSDYFSRGGTVKHFPMGATGLPESDDWIDWEPSTELDVAEFATRNGLAALS